MSDEEIQPEARDIRDMRVDAENLYREEVFTDLRVATIRRMTPIKVDGSQDESRPVLFSGETQILTQGGLIPIHASIEAVSLQDAIDKFPEAVQAAVERLMDEARELQRREMSRIVVPGSGTLPPPPGGGKIDLG